MVLGNLRSDKDPRFSQASWKITLVLSTLIAIGERPQIWVFQLFSIFKNNIIIICIKNYFMNWMNEKGKGGIKKGEGGIPFEKAIQLPEPPVPEQMHSTTFPQLEFSSFSSCLDRWYVHCTVLAVHDFKCFSVEYDYFPFSFFSWKCLLVSLFPYVWTRTYRWNLQTKAKHMPATHREERLRVMEGKY
jgi:hypothetical protein